MLPIGRHYTNRILQINHIVLSEMLNYTPFKWSKVPKEDIPKHLKKMQEIEWIAKILELKESKKLLKRIIDALENAEKKALNYNEFLGSIKELDRRVQDELEAVEFGCIPPTYAKYFNKEQLFGKDIYEKFPTANVEITEAGNCYAHFLFTASVFHSMRAVELCAKIMVKAMKAEKHITATKNVGGIKTTIKKPLELCDWGTLIGGMDAALKELQQGSATNSKKKDNFVYYSHAVGLFRNFKDAWRNNVAHGYKNYTSKEARNILENTRQFIEHLAQRLSEKT